MFCDQGNIVPENSGIVRGQALQVAGRKCKEKMLFRRPKKQTNFEKDQRFFAVVLSQKNLDVVDMWKM